MSATENRWRRLQDLFTAAVDLPPEQRESFIRDAVVDADIKAEVRALLAAHAPGRLDSMTEQSGVFQTPSPAEPGLLAMFERLRTGLADRYRIIRELGRGGMATVHLAEDVKHRRSVALKVLRPEIAATLGAARFLREIQLAAQLQHPHIIPLLDSGETDGVFYYVTPYIAGGSLRDLLDRTGPLPVDDALRLLGAVAAALDYAHSAGVIHRDIKPENILLYEGETLVADFGIAVAVSSAAGERITETGISLGTPQYMSPEQAAAERDIDARADVYSLGCVLYEALAGEPPYTGPTAQAVIAKALSAPVPLLSAVRGVPPDVDRAITTALAKHRADRFASAGQFIHAVRSATTQPTPARRSGMRLPALILGAVLVAILAMWAWVATRGTPRAARGVAVLYFDNLSPDSTDAYLADGLTEEIIARLGDISRIAVQSRAAVRRFRGAEGTAAATDPSSVGRALGVTYLVTGSVRRAGPRVRVVVELMNTATGARVWGQTFEPPGRDVLAIEDEIAQAVAGVVVGRLAPTERAVLTVRPTESADAYDHYLRGNFYLARRVSEADGRRALAEYEAALRLDPAFAAAYGRMGLVYGIYANWPWDYPGLSLDSLFARGLAAADRALALDSASVDGLLARGFLLIPHPGDADAQRAFALDPSLLGLGLALACPPGVSDCAQQAVRELAQAVRLAPRDAEVWYQYGRALHVSGRGSSALMVAGDSAIARSLALEPDRRVSAWLLGMSHLRQRRYDAALTMLDSAIALGRRDPSVFSLRLHARLGRGDVTGARADLDTLAALLAARGDPLGPLYLASLETVVAAGGGDTTTAGVRLADLVAHYPPRSLSSRTERLILAAAYASAGDRERAIALLERLPPAAWGGLVNRVWDGVRDDPRLRRL